MNDKPKSPDVGDVISDRYELVEEIGRGGFGVVYRALQLGMQRDVAVKLLHPVGDDSTREEMRERFKREAMMARNLNHPHTIRQYDFGETENGLMFLVLEYLEGKNLVEIIRSTGALGDKRTRKMARGALKSLSEAHAQGIVHRDLKPANIMLCEVYGESDYVKVLDFGIAKTVRGDTDLTAAGVALGSPRYMPPELLRGDDPTPAADVYSLAITLGESIIGKALIDVENSVEAAQLQLSDDRIPVPPELEASSLWPWLSVALNKEIDQRYASAEEMLSFIDASPEELESRGSKGGGQDEDPIASAPTVQDADASPADVVAARPTNDSGGQGSVSVEVESELEAGSEDAEKASGVIVGDSDFVDDAPTQMVHSDELPWFDEDSKSGESSGTKETKGREGPGLTAPLSPVSSGSNPPASAGGASVSPEGAASDQKDAEPGTPEKGMDHEAATQMLSAVEAGLVDESENKGSKPAQVGNAPTIKYREGESESKGKFPSVKAPGEFSRSAHAAASEQEVEKVSKVKQSSPGRGKWIAAIVVLALLAVFGILALVYVIVSLQDGSDASPVAVPIETNAKDGAEEQAAAQIEFRVYSIPEGAMVSIEGRDPMPTPARIQIAESELPLTAELERRGFESESIELAVDKTVHNVRMASIERGDEEEDVEQLETDDKDVAEPEPAVEPEPKPRPKPKPKPKPEPEPDPDPGDDLIPLFE